MYFFFLAIFFPNLLKQLYSQQFGNDLKYIDLGAGEIAQQLKELASLPEDSCSVLRPCMWLLITTYNATSEALMPSSGLSGHIQM